MVNVGSGERRVRSWQLRAARWAGLSLAGLALASGCGGAGESAGGNSGLSGSGGVGGDAGSSGSGGSGATFGSCRSSTDCGPGTFCSAAQVCVDDGACAAAADCQPGEYCSTAGNCIAQGSCGETADCGPGLECTAGSCVPGGGCGAEEFSIERVAPNLFIALDRSCSMRRADGLPASKWQIAVDALVQLTTTYSGQVRWGLGLFPDNQGGSCDQGTPDVALADNTEGRIQTLLSAALQTSDANYPNGPCVTNIDTAMQQASQQPELKDTLRNNFVLLITDGKQAGCSSAGGDNGTTQIIASLQTAGVSTFVVGFGAGVDPAQLNVFADAGGVPRANPADPTIHYYQADDQASLDAALSTIAGSIVGCSFALNGKPDDPNALYVFFDDQSVPRDPSHSAGWDYDPLTNQITFYGQECTSLKADLVKDVDVVFGCDEPVPS